MGIDKAKTESLETGIWEGMSRGSSIVRRFVRWEDAARERLDYFIE